jgi:glutathione S-transferase
MVNELHEVKLMLPVLYSFRRCPYAIRARMTLLYTAQQVELREVFLGNKPAQMLHASAKGTVPVLVFPDGTVLQESVDVMHWALRIQDPDNWWREESAAEINSLLEQNDFDFKQQLDRYKYWQRYPEHPQQYYREKAEEFLRLLEQKLQTNAYLLNENVSFADVAIFPFIRQFAFADKPWFEQAPYPRLQHWLQSFLDSDLFKGVMKKSPAWHLNDAPLLFPDISPDG